VINKPIIMASSPRARPGIQCVSIEVSEALHLPSLRRHGPRQLYSEGRVSFDDTGRYFVPAFCQCRVEKGRRLRDSVVLVVVHCQRQNRDQCEHVV
jgi:hypothetical protein